MNIYFGKRNEYFVEGKYWETIKKDLEPTVVVNNYKDGAKWLTIKLKELDYKSYYSKMNFSVEDNWIEIDFGSHYLFCIFYNLSKEDWKTFMRK